MYALYIFMAMMAISAAPAAPCDDRGLRRSSSGSEGHALPSPAQTALIVPVDESPVDARLASERMPETTASRAAKATRETVLWSYRWTPSLVSIRITRDSVFRFTPGHYARLGIANPTLPAVFRPLSVASAPADAYLEFFCSLIPGGEFSGRLASLRVGAPVEVERASFGFLTVDSLAPGTDLWLLASGTGLAPFLSMLRDPGVWEAFDHIIVVHSVRHAAELAYADDLQRLAEQSPGTAARAALHYLPVVTREPGASTLPERIPVLLASGSLAKAAGVSLDPAYSRVMACGNPDMTRELRALLGERGFRTTRRGVRGQIAFEKYW
jgi:ferredoxin/flavodoxin---NADP+ reductase